MALFGAPVAHEDHAVRACYAALRMQPAMKAYADEVRRAHAAVVKIRVGLNSGEVVVRASGSDLRMDYSAVGQTTHLAARMEQIAEPGAIVIAPPHPGPGRRIRRGEVARARAAEGPGRRGGGLPADGNGAGAHTAPGGGASRS